MLAPAAGAATAKLAYVTGDAATEWVWVANADGSHPQQLGQGGLPLISPDGAVVAAARFGSSGPALVLLRPGAPERDFFDLHKVGATPESWSPDSRYLAVGLQGTAVKGGPQNGLAVIDTKTGSARTISHGFPCGASFAPRVPDRLVWARSPGGAFCLKRVNLFTAMADGSRLRRITRDGRSLNPVWGPRAIAFDRQTPRRHDSPVYQVFLMRADGTHRRQLTHLHIPPLLNGLVPVRFSARGNRLLAAFEGQDTSETWTVSVGTRRARQLTAGGHSVLAAGISRDGRAVLVQGGPLQSSPSHGVVETIPFSGGPPHVLVRHAGQPSWNH
jgi:hypothetical protein